MPNFLPLIIVLIGVFTIMDKAKKAKTAKEAQACREESAHRRGVPEIRQQPAPEARRPLAPALEATAPGQMRPRISARPTPTVMAPEGEDPCHDDMLFEQQNEGSAPASPEARAAQAAAQELLRGVVLSEILRRPRQRAYRPRKSA